MAELTPHHFNPQDVPTSWKVPGVNLEERTINQIDKNSGFLSTTLTSSRDERLTTLDYFFNEQGVPIDSMYKTLENVIMDPWYFRATQTRSLLKTSLTIGYHTSTLDYNALRGESYENNLGKIMYLNKSDSQGYLHQIHFGELMQPTDADTIPKVYLDKQLYKKYDVIDAWKPSGINLDLPLEKLDDRKYLVIANDKKEYTLSWETYGGYLVASLTDNATADTKRIEAATSMDTTDIRKQLMANAPYPKDESGLLNVPWTRAINLFPARLAYLQPRQEQETPDSN